MIDRVIVAGAGWRVQRFVVPALLTVGVPADRITILRRQADVPLPGFGDLDVVGDPSHLPAPGEVALTVNCVTAGQLVHVQEGLLRRYPRVVHFCDTPIFSATDSLARVFAFRKYRLFALEDWPLLPNLVYLKHLARKSRQTAVVRLEHFGIPLHFVAWYRCVHGDTRLTGRSLLRVDNTIRAAPRSAVRVVFRGPKALARAKWSFQTQDELVEDFHEVNPAHGISDEVFYRIVADNRVGYFQGTMCVDRESLSESVLGGFAPLDDRRNVHELDKLVALVRIFRSVVTGGRIRAYPFMKAVRDTLTLRRLEVKAACLLR